MEKVAVISDIHGNYIALESVIEDAKKLGIEKFIISGDLVNEFPFGNKVIDIIKSLKEVYVVKGNREQYLIEYDEAKYDWNNIQFRNNVFMYNELSKENLEYNFKNSKVSRLDIVTFVLSAFAIICNLKGTFTSPSLYIVLYFTLVLVPNLCGVE